MKLTETKLRQIIREEIQRLDEGKATSFDMTKLKYFSKASILDILKSHEFRNRRVIMSGNLVGGTKKDTLYLIKVLLQKDKEAGEELGITDMTNNQKSDWKYLKSIR